MKTQTCSEINFAINNYEYPPVIFVEHKRNQIELTIKK
jgi:hypothetical protein